MRHVLVASVLLAIAGCGADAPTERGEPAGGPHDADAQMRPDLIVAETARVAPGDIMSLSFPAQTMRGIHFVLERQAGDGWIHEFDLVSDGPGPSWPRDWRPAGDEDFAIPDIAVVGEGPDRVLIPDVAEPGSWRICTGNAGENICAEIEIVES